MTKCWSHPSMPLVCYFDAYYWHPLVWDRDVMVLVLTLCAIWLSWVVYIVASNNYSYFCEKFDEAVKGLRWWFHRLIVLSRKNKFCLVTLYIVVLPWIPSRIEMVLFLIVNWIKSWITFIQFWSLTYVQFYNFAYELARYLVQVIILGLNQ